VAKRAQPNSRHQPQYLIAGTAAGLRALAAQPDDPYGPPLTRIEILRLKWRFQTYEARFNETKNPLWAWRALNAALGVSRSVVPPWVTAYLYRVSSQMLVMTETDVPHDDIPPAVYRALEFRAAKGHNPFSDDATFAHNVLLAQEVMRHIDGGKKSQFAFVDAAREHPTKCGHHPKCEDVSPSTVARAYKKYGPGLRRLRGSIDDENRRRGLNVK
jgi:hypothetical protein